MQQKLSKAQIREKQNEAFRLVIRQRLTQKEACGILGVAEKTMTAWAKKLKWHDAKKVIENSTQLQLLNINAFEVYLKANSEADYQTFKRCMAAYIEACTRPETVFWIM